MGHNHRPHAHELSDCLRDVTTGSATSDSASAWVDGSHHEDVRNLAWAGIATLLLLATWTTNWSETLAEAVAAASPVAGQQWVLVTQWRALR